MKVIFRGKVSKLKPGTYNAQLVDCAVEYTGTGTMELVLDIQTKPKGGDAVEEKKVKQPDV